MKALEDLKAGAVMSKLVTARECEAYRRAIDDALSALRAGEQQEWEAEFHRVWSWAMDHASELPSGYKKDAFTYVIHEARANMMRALPSTGADQRPHQCPHGNWNAADCEQCKAPVAARPAPREERRHDGPDWRADFHIERRKSAAPAEAAPREQADEWTWDAERCIAWLEQKAKRHGEEGDYQSAKLMRALASPPPAPEQWISVPKLETEEMQDAARGILQILRGKPGANERDVWLWCDGRGDSTKGLHEHDTAYVTEARAAAMIYRAMLSAAPVSEKKEG